MSAVSDIENTEDTLSDAKEFLTVVIANQRFGIPILQIQDVLGPQAITKVPLAPLEVAGALNLRGRIVTAIDVRKRLKIEDENEKSSNKSMGVVVEYNNELYNLIIDSVGDVLKLKDADFESTPATLDPLWRDVSTGICRLEKELLVILNIPKLISTVHN